MQSLGIGALCTDRRVGGQEMAEDAVFTQPHHLVAFLIRRACQQEPLALTVTLWLWLQGRCNKDSVAF